jgi:alkylhydroperoxidase family enzyme
VRAEQITALADYLESAEFDAVERAVLAYADAMTTTPASVDDRLFARLRQHLDEGQLVELTAAIAWENWRARFNWAFGLGKEGYSEGAYCVPVVSAN